MNNENDMRKADFCSGDPLAKFLSENIHRLTIDECKKIIDDHVAGKEDWMPEM